MDDLSALVSTCVLLEVSSVDILTYFYFLLVSLKPCLNEKFRIGTFSIQTALLAGNLFVNHKVQLLLAPNT